MENQDDAFAALAISFIQKAKALKAISAGPYAHINTNTTTTINNVNALESIVVNTAGTGWTLTVYDNNAASGNVIAVISANAQGNFLYHDVIPTTGSITIVSAGTTPGDVTVSTV